MQQTQVKIQIDLKLHINRHIHTHIHIKTNHKQVIHIKINIPLKNNQNMYDFNKNLNNQYNLILILQMFINMYQAPLQNQPILQFQIINQLNKYLILIIYMKDLFIYQQAHNILILN